MTVLDPYPTITLALGERSDSIARKTGSVIMVYKQNEENSC